MNIAIICFTRKGACTALKLKALLEEQGELVRIWCKKKEFPDLSEGKDKIEALDMPLRQWTGMMFPVSDALIFVGATGIAVRSIAPFLKSKITDPAVITVDELGKFVISLVSGHIGGANELCQRMADGLEAVPVITTATDLNGKFAVDVFARKNNLWISDMKTAKLISAVLLDGKQVGFCSDFPWTGEAGPELRLSQQVCSCSEAEPPEVRILEPDRKAPLEYGESVPESTGQRRQAEPCGEIKYGICVSLDERKRPYPQTLQLVPRIAVLGLGCRRGKSGEDLEQFVLKLLAENHISIKAVEKVCSIDVKADEEGILEFCRKYGLLFETYPADLLARTEGAFTASSFVSSQVGVDNVCERSAVRGSGGGRLWIRKTARSGMTAALALREWRVHFE